MRNSLQSEKLSTVTARSEVMIKVCSFLHKPKIFIDVILIYLMKMGKLYVCGLMLLLLIFVASLVGQGPCEDVACCRVCRGDDSLKQKCINGLFMLAAADLPSPPILHVNLTYNNEKIESIFFAQILVCMSNEEIEQSHEYTEIVAEQLAIKEIDRDRDCYWHPAPGCWSECGDSTCNFACFSLEHSRRFKLAIYVPQFDKVFVSGEIEMKDGEEFYWANLLPDGTIDMEETAKSTGKPEPTDNHKAEPINDYKVGMFIKALSITLLIELLIALVCINICRTTIPRHLETHARVLLTVFLANIISLPMLWFILLSILNSFLMVILGEVLVVLFEGVLIHFLNKTILSIKGALLFSFILNMGSLFLGYPLYFLLFFGG